MPNAYHKIPPFSHSLGRFLPFSQRCVNGRFSPALAPKRTSGFRPDYATPDRRRAQNQPLLFAPILVMQRAADAFPQQTLSLTPATQQNLEPIQALKMRRTGGLENALRIISGDADHNRMREAEVSLDGMLGNAAI